MIALLLLVSNALADPLMTTMKKGEIAPFEGTLLNQEAIARILAEAEASEKRCKASIESMSETKDSECKKERDIIESRLLSCETSLSKSDSDYQKLAKKYNRNVTMMPYVAGAGFVGGVALTVVIAGVVNGAIQ